MNRGELRPRWGIVVFILILSAITAVVMMPVAYFFLGHRNPSAPLLPLPAAIQELSVLVSLLAASVIMTRIEHAPVISYGLEGTGRFRKFIFGALSGFVALSALVGAMWAFGFLHFDGVFVYGWSGAGYALAWGITFLLVGIYEEYLLRGYLLNALSREIGFWKGAIILSIAFGAMHISNTGESPVGIFSAAAIGLIFCISLWYLKTLWWAIGFHAAWDWAESYFYGTADSGTVSQGHLFGVHPQGSALWSGGATGPEGSLLIVPLILAVALLMWLVWRNGRNVSVRRESLPASE